MLPLRLATYTAQELERRSREFLSIRLGSAVAPPIDIEWLLETEPGIDLDLDPHLRDKHFLDGCVLRDPDRNTLLILVDEKLADKNPNRYRSTLAEELGHCVLHRDLIQRFDTIDDFRQLQNHQDYPAIERNAKRFGAAVLMPGDLVTACAELVYPELVRVAGYNDVAAIKKFLCTQLSKKFSVSTHTMAIRLGEWPVKVDSRVEASVSAQLDFLTTDDSD